jgi:hypothetical protein
MIRRRHVTKPTLALWMLVAVVDIALLAAAAGPLIVTLCVAALALAIGAVKVVRRTEPNTEVAVRRRA